MANKVMKSGNEVLAIEEGRKQKFENSKVKWTIFF